MLLRLNGNAFGPLELWGTGSGAAVHEARCAVQWSRLPPSLFRAPRLRDSTAPVDDLRFNAAKLRRKLLLLEILSDYSLFIFTDNRLQIKKLQG